MLFSHHIYLGLLLLSSSAPYANSRGTQTNPSFGAVPKQKKPLPLGLRDDCNFLDSTLEGIEGTVPKNIASLRGIGIAFRHGDRATLYGDCDSPSLDCSAQNDSERRVFMDYIGLVKSDQYKKFLAIDPLLEQYERFPHPTLCSCGGLTAVGVLQQLKHGSFLRQKYVEDGFLTSGNEWNISVLATQFPRTFQSAIAFVSTFLYPLNTKFPQIHLTASETEHFCLTAKCKCENIQATKDRYEQIRCAFYERIVDKKILDYHRELVNFIQIKEVDDPIRVMDVLLGNYICRGFPLPCNNGTCLQIENVAKVADSITDREAEMFNASSLFRRLLVTQAAGVLQSVVESAENLRKFPHSKRLHIFSGHDNSLRSLLFVLGITHREPPPFASRLIFEIYEVKKDLKSQSKYFFQVIYNGMNQTPKAAFCSEKLYHGLCPIEELENFVENKLHEMANGKSLNELCEMPV